MLWRTCVLSLLLVLAGAARAVNEEPPFALPDPGGQMRDAPSLLTPQRHPFGYIE